ncbi:hypothetical protein KJ359_001687 [Pestalotiopsis sp. 9143b]|nr:hypothetical protein KJ359_001687 [Pestalotiopsis sp. 9143b]
MSGVEAAAVLGVISSVIAIVDGTKKVYDAASSATGLPIAFREVSTRLPIVKGILESTKQHIDDAHTDTASYSVIKTLIEACEDRAKRLKAIFDKVIPGDEDSRLTRYISAAKTLGKGERVETLMQALMKDVLLLASKHVMELATSQQVVGLSTSIKELSAIDPSLPDAALENTAFTNNNFGAGPKTNNNVIGNQKYQANYGTGKQFQAEEQIFHMGKDD